MDNFGGQIWNLCNWRHLVVKFGINMQVAKLATNASGAIWCTNLQPIQEVSLKSISNYSSWEIYSSYGLNTLGLLCLWQCFLYCYCYFHCYCVERFVHNVTSDCYSYILSRLQFLVTLLLLYQLRHDLEIGLLFFKVKIVNFLRKWGEEWCCAT